MSQEMKKLRKAFYNQLGLLARKCFQLLRQNPFKKKFHVSVSSSILLFEFTGEFSVFAKRRDGIDG